VEKTSSEGALFSVLFTHCCAGDKIMKNEMGGACSLNRGEACIGFWWKNLRERPLGRRRHSWEDNIKVDFQ
jgi:hypothetical protein